MRINIDKILSEKAKVTIVNDGFKTLLESAKEANTMEAFSNYIQELNKCGDTVIKENMVSLLENGITTRYLNYYITTESCCLSELKNLNDEISKKIESCHGDSDYLTFTKKKLDNVIEHMSSNEWLKVDTKYQLACERYASCCVYESSVVSELDMLRYTININPTEMNEYTKLLAKIDTEPFAKIESSFPTILKLNTDLILGLDVVLTDQSKQLVSSMPMTLAKRLVVEGSVKQKKAFIKILDKQIYNLRASLKTADARLFPVLRDYMTNLNDARDMLVSECNVVKEHIADMQPDIIMYEDGIIEDPIGDLDDLIAEFMFDDDDEDDEKCDKTLESLCALRHRINNAFIVTEDGGLAKATRKVAYGLSKAGNKAASKVDKARKNAERTKVALKKGTDPFVNMVNKTVNDIRKMDKDERRERIITGQFKFKLFKQLKKGILITAGVGAVVTASGVLATIGAAVVSVIVVLGSLAIDKRMDDKVRREILHELEAELAVVNEKLEDSRGDEKKENKYQLIRIKKKLEGTIDSVKFSLKEKDFARKTDN